MKQFIEPNELARDTRFIRQANVVTTMLATLPDDVDAVVDAFEKFDPMIAEGVRGTAAETLYEEYGPGFGLVTLSEPLDPDAPGADMRLKLRMVGAKAGQFPESTFLFECACADDPALRVAGVNRGLEGLACDVFRDMIRYADQIGDETMKQAIDYVLADELTHVRFGSDWVKEFTRDDPERYEKAQEFRRAVDKQFSFGGARSERPDAAIPIAWDDRREAGFSEHELEELKQISSSGPTRDTMRSAARILRERHQARRDAASEGASA
jgi:hypothetical protein